jgi:hypothetical protein
MKSVWSPVATGINKKGSFMQQFQSVVSRHLLAVFHRVSALVSLGLALACSVAYAGTTITAPTVANGKYVNGVLFSASVTSDVARVELSANSFAFGTLNAANNWQLRYTFTNLGTRDIAAKSYSASGTLLSTHTIRINVVDVLLRSPSANANYMNGTAVTISASAAVSYVILKAETFEIGRSGARDANGDFLFPPAIMGTLGSRTFNAEAYNANGTKIGTDTVPVNVVNVAFTSPPAGATFDSGTTFTARVATVSTATRVDYYADSVLVDTMTNVSENFKRDISLVNSGNRSLRAVAFNASGTKLGEASIAITINGGPVTTCQFGPWTTYNGIALRRHSSGAYIYKTSHKSIDADGAPNAYHPADVGKPCSASAGLLGLDCPANAGYPNGGFWKDVLVVDPNDSSRPYVQRSGPHSGFFISKTSLQDAAKSATDASRYVNSTTIPFIVFPGNFYSMSGTGRMGDLGYAINLSNNKKTAYVAADVGPSAASLGESSIAFLVNLGGINPNPINGAGAPSATVLYVNFPNSTATYRWPMTNAQMQSNVQQLLATVGGEAGILACKDAL